MKTSTQSNENHSEIIAAMQSKLSFYEKKFSSQETQINFQANQINKQSKELKNQKEAIQTRDSLIENLEYRLSLALMHRYGRRSEKLSDDEVTQLNLFDEAEVTVAEEEKQVEETITVPAHERKKRGKKKLPVHLPRIEKVHDIEDKQCECGHELHVIGEEKSERLEIIPAFFYVIAHIRKQYGCRACESIIRTAKMPPQAIPKSIAGPGLLAHVAVSKYMDHLPLYRQEAILQRSGVEMKRATLANWMLKAGTLLLPLIKLMKGHIEEHDLSFADETTLQVLKEPGRNPDNKSYMWVFGGGPPDKFCWVLEYHPTRCADVPKKFFENFKGYLHSDGYKAYECLSNVTLVSCMAHARRKFMEVYKTAKKKKGLASVALAFIKSLYDIEKEAKALSFEERKAFREEKSLPILEKYKHWLDEKSRTVPPKSPIGKAFSYSIGRWVGLTRYLENGRLEIDNNRTERVAKAFATGRKNWLFSNSTKGAFASSVIYSLIETCKFHHIDPYAYLRHVFTEIPTSTTMEALEKLLPFNCDKTVLAKQLERPKIDFNSTES